MGRRNTATTNILKTCSSPPWNEQISRNFWFFDRHILRNTNGRLWSSAIRQTRDETWLQNRRTAEYLERSSLRRTRTRAIVGHIAQSWERGVAVASCFIT